MIDNDDKSVFLFSSLSLGFYLNVSVSEEFVDRKRKNKEYKKNQKMIVVVVVVVVAAHVHLVHA